MYKWKTSVFVVFSRFQYGHSPTLCKRRNKPLLAIMPNVTGIFCSGACNAGFTETHIQLFESVVRREAYYKLCVMLELFAYPQIGDIEAEGFLIYLWWVPIVCCHNPCRAVF